MSNVLGIWHLVLKGGEEKNFITPAAVQITNVCLGEEIADANGRSVVKLSFESLSPFNEEDEDEDDNGDEPEEPGLTIVSTVLCALTPGKIEQATLNIILNSDEHYAIQVSGKNTIYLTGQYLDQRGPEDEFDSDEEAFDLREVSSDVEVDPKEFAGLESDEDRFEEVNEESATKPTKRSRDSGDDAASKPEKKKLKADGGKAVPVDTPAPNEEPKKETEKKQKKKQKKAEAKNDQEKKEDKQESKSDTASKRTIAGDIVIQDHKIGTGPKAKKGDKVQMRYIGKLTNGKEFDKNTSGKPFTFSLGKEEVIKGWDEGIVGMQVGGERLLTIPPNMAYGKRGHAGIPPNSTLIFEVKLLHIK